MKLKIILAVLILIILIIGVTLACVYHEPKVAVLCYHNVGTKEEKANFPEEKDWVIDLENFEEQLKYLKEAGYKTLTTQEFLDWKNGKIEVPFKSVLITFDDGFLSNYEYAFPLLKKYDMNATVFVIGGYMKQEENGNLMGRGKKHWKKNMKEYMNLETIEDAKKEYPNIEFASHSLGLHYQNSIREKTVEELTADLQVFKQEITDTKVYAYPFGANNDNMVQALKNAGYDMAFIYGPTNKEYRKVTRRDDVYHLPRLNVSHGMDLTKFKLRLALPF